MTGQAKKELKPILPDSLEGHKGKYSISMFILIYYYFRTYSIALRLRRLTSRNKYRYFAWDTASQYFPLIVGSILLSTIDLTYFHSCSTVNKASSNSCYISFFFIFYYILLL